MVREIHLQYGADHRQLHHTYGQRGKVPGADTRLGTCNSFQVYLPSSGLDLSLTALGGVALLAVCLGLAYGT